MSSSSPKQLCFPPVACHTVQADFDSGALSSYFRALLHHGQGQKPLPHAIESFYSVCHPGHSRKRCKRQGKKVSVKQHRADTSASLERELHKAL
jgi:hypothetical protein